MRRSRARPSRLDGEPEGVRDGTIIVAGIVAGVLISIASLFWTLPERIVRETTGVGAPPEPSMEVKALWVLARGDVDEAVRMFADWAAGSTRTRFGCLLCAMCYLDDDSAVEREIVERLGAKPPDAITASGPQDLGYMVGTWVVRTTNDQFVGVNTVRRIADGRAYLERWSAWSPSVDTRSVYVFSNRRDDEGSWVRVLISRSQAQMYAYAGPVIDGYLELRHRLSPLRSGIGTDARMRMHSTGPDSFVRALERRDADGAWSATVQWEYTRLIEPVAGTPSVE